MSLHAEACLHSAVARRHAAVSMSSGCVLATSLGCWGGGFCEQATTLTAHAIGMARANGWTLMRDLLGPLAMHRAYRVTACGSASLRRPPSDAQVIARVPHRHGG